jgi:hypothetical protein
MGKKVAGKLLCTTPESELPEQMSNSISAEKF